MIKRILIILFIMLIVGGFFSKDALAGPPWPAEVIQIREGESCWFSWLDKSGNTILLYGQGMWEVQWKNGQAQWNCHTTIDFTDPEIATFEEARGYFESWGLTDYFRSNGAFRVTTSTQPIPLACEWDSDHPLADNAIWITTPNGNTNISCHFTFEP